MEFLEVSKIRQSSAFPVKKASSIATQIQRVWGQLLRRRKYQLFFVSLLTILVSVAEVISVGAVIPFLAALVEPKTVFDYSYAKPFLEAFDIDRPEDIPPVLTFAFIGATLVAGFLRIMLLWSTTRLSMAVGADFGIKVYERTLHESYIFHVTHNSSELLAGIKKADGLGNIFIQPLTFAISSLVILSSLIATLLSINAVVSVYAFLGLGFVYGLIGVITRIFIKRNSKIIASHQIGILKAAQEGLGAIRNVIIDGTQAVYSRLYRSAFLPLQAAQAANQVVAISPRYAVEAAGMACIAGLAYTMMKTNSPSIGDASSTIAAIGAFALAAQKILPLMQQIYSTYITLTGNYASTEDALDLLDYSLATESSVMKLMPVTFERSITLRKISFRYSSSGPWILKNLDLEILKGSRLGIVGQSGAGKSTLCDILLGLLVPNEGELRIDGTAINLSNSRSWQNRIAHVPQTLFLTDSSITENIALGESLGNIDLNRVKYCARQAQIAATIETWDRGYDTLVGERGIRLSGGQRQRIALARALYKRADVIILDEVTSSLDSETESEVMNTISGLDGITLVFVTHRKSVLKYCDIILELKKNNDIHS